MQIDELIETFEFLTDWEDRYRVLIDLGRQLPELPESEKTEANRVQGCTSKVWLIPLVQPGDPPIVEFRADSDSHIVKGLLAIILTTYSGKTPQQILATDIEEIFRRLGLQQNLTPNRRSGFYATVERIKKLAADQAKS
jgi:cysteine desulfuration protein SufE